VDGDHGLARIKATTKIKVMNTAKIARVIGKFSGLPEMERLTRVSKERQAAGKILKIFWFFESSEDVCIEILLPVCPAVHPGLSRIAC
jgi:hypothetical protein